MSLTALRAAVVSSIASNISTFRAVQAHGGKFNVEELKRIAVQSPACLITMLGGPFTRQGVQAVGAVQIVAFVVTGGTSATKRDEAALVLAEALAGLVAENKWDYEHAKAPERMALGNLYSGELDRAGVALWAVTWTQQADLAIFDPTTLDDLNQVHTQTDLAPRDGVNEDELAIWLQGTLMSAYGNAYVSTPAATSIAAADTYQKVAGTTTLLNYSGMDMPVSNRLRHTGTVSKDFLVQLAASLTVSADAKVTLTVAKNGVAIEECEIEEECTLAGGAESLKVSTTVALGENDYVEAWVKADDTVNVTATKLNLVAVAT